MKNIVIFGANGLVGSEVVSNLQHKGQLLLKGYCFRRKSKKHLKSLDILNEGELTYELKRYKPHAIFHCANLDGDLDFFEANPALAENFHWVATKNIVDLAQEFDSKLIYLSTDAVFDGSIEEVSELAPKNPLNNYGKFKAKSEDYIQSKLNNYLIVRTTNIYGHDSAHKRPNNFLMQVIRSLQKKEAITAPNNLYGSPTYSKDLGKVLVELAFSKVSGLFHMVGPDFLDHYSWGVQIAKALSLDVGLVQPKELDFSQGAKRPPKLKLLSGDKEVIPSFTKFEEAIKEVADLIKKEM